MAVTDLVIAAPANEDAARILDALRQGDSGVRLRLGEDDDVTGHLMADPAIVRVVIEDDTEGHTLDLRLPSAADAEEFRRRLLLAGVLTAALVLGAGGVALAAGQDGSSIGDSGRIENVSYEDTNPYDGTV
jgi:hypothetical protein